MTVSEMKRLKKERGYTFNQISLWSGVPLGTVQKIFNGETENPRYDTLSALEHVFADELVVMESAEAYKTMHHKQGEYTIDDYYALPEDHRVELIDGCFYDMGAPRTLHQLIAGDMHRQIANYIYDRNGKCMPLIAPTDVQLDCDNKTMVQPDVMILCDEERLLNQCVYGAPDFLMEVISPSTKRKDYVKKLQKYEHAGVREYWILDPYEEKVLIYFFEADWSPRIMGLNQPIPVNIYNSELSIDLSRVAEWVKRYK